MTGLFPGVKTQQLASQLKPKKVTLPSDAKPHQRGPKGAITSVPWLAQALPGHHPTHCRTAMPLLVSHVFRSGCCGVCGVGPGWVA
jgi:hypothetical protein